MKTQIPHAEAMKLAEELAAQLRPFTTRLAIVGSLRRGKPTVGDIELLCVPRFEKRADGLFDTIQVNLAEEQITKWHTEGTPVDLFSTTEENWFTSLVIRTGSLETNLKLTTGAQKQGCTLKVYGAGIEWPDGEVTRAESEEDVFRLCGVAYLNPRDR